jgi:hypothetical protein
VYQDRLLAVDKLQHVTACLVATVLAYSFSGHVTALPERQLPVAILIALALGFCKEVGDHLQVRQPARSISFLTAAARAVALPLQHGPAPPPPHCLQAAQLRHLPAAPHPPSPAPVLNP